MAFLSNIYEEVKSDNNKINIAIDWLEFHGALLQTGDLFLQNLVAYPAACPSGFIIGVLEFEVVWYKVIPIPHPN